MRKTIAIDLASGLLVLLFVYAAISKLLNFQLFEFQLGKSPFTADYAQQIAWIVPLSELTIVGLLIYHKTRFLGLSGAFFLMLLFTIYVYAILHWADHVPCSCGGVISKLSWQQHFILNISFLVIAFVGLFMDIFTTKNPYPAVRK